MKHDQFPCPTRELRFFEDRPRVVTRTGIVIGGAYVEPPPAPSADAEDIQLALLRQRQADRSWLWAGHVIYAIALGLGMALFMGLLR